MQNTKQNKKGSKMIKVEARVQGILRGGYLIKGKFVFHSGTMKIETKDYTELKILN